MNKNYNEFHHNLTIEECKKHSKKCTNCGVPFCQAGVKIGNSYSGCPLNNLIPEFNLMIVKDNLKSAYDRLKLTNNFPEFTGRVCPALCEKACVQGAVGETVPAKSNEYNIIENAFEKGYVTPHLPESRTGKKIAVIGSGPAGLAAADLLNQRGHSITVFERSDSVGGLLMYGIPNMKLDKKVINRRIDLMKAEGIVFKTNTDVGKDIKASQLLKEFDRIILACGASKPRDIQVKGRDSKGIYYAVDFLKTATKALLDDLQKEPHISAKEKSVLIIGGGDTGNDCVATCIRQGAKSVIQLEIMPKLPENRAETNPWPEYPFVHKTDYGLAEAIEVFGKDPRVYETTVKEFIADKNGNLKGAMLVKVKAENGKIQEIQNSQYTVDVDIVLIAAGFVGTESYIAKEFGITLDKKNNVATKSNSHETETEKVFVAGDMRKGQSLVVWAIKDGREVAAEVDKSLMGYTNL